MKLRLAAGLLLAPALLLTACSGSVSVGTDPAVPKAQVEEKVSTGVAETTDARRHRLGHLPRRPHRQGRDDDEVHRPPPADPPAG